MWRFYKKKIKRYNCDIKLMQECHQYTCNSSAGFIHKVPEYTNWLKIFFWAGHFIHEWH